MAKNQYEGYQYIDLDNFYTYKNSTVLINKQNILDSNSAKNNEHLHVSKRLADLYIQPILVYSTDDIQKIHKYLFQDVYSWAGQYRRVNISKSGNAFMPVQSFDMAEKFLNTLLSNYLLNANNKIEICKSLAEILDNLNYFHPFREGNGRTQREVIRSLALMKGYECEISIGLDDDIYHLYMDGTVYGDTSKLEQLFNKLLTEI